MSKWICQIDSQEYNSEEEARDAVLDYIDTCDFERAIECGESVTFSDIIKELQRLESPLYYRLLEEVQETIFHDYFYEESEEDED